jgi:hypothetical protein
MGALMWEPKRPLRSPSTIRSGRMAINRGAARHPQRGAKQECTCIASA